MLRWGRQPGSGVQRGKAGVGAEQLPMPGPWAEGRCHRCSSALKSAGSRCGRDVSETSPRGACRRVPKAPGDVKMLWCKLTSGDSVGAWSLGLLHPRHHCWSGGQGVCQGCSSAQLRWKRGGRAAPAGKGRQWRAAGAAQCGGQRSTSRVTCRCESVISLKPARFKGGFCLSSFSLAHHPGRERKHFSD